MRSAGLQHFDYYNPEPKQFMESIAVCSTAAIGFSRTSLPPDCCM